MKQKNLHSIYDDIGYQRAKYIVPVILTMILLVIYILPFLNYIIFVDKDIRIPQDVGFVYKHTYDRHVENHLQSLDNFDLKIELYFNQLEINDIEYQVVFSSDDLFDVGMVNNAWDYEDINLYRFNFLYGKSFTESNQIVITENISQKLFQSKNSVNQQIEIGEQMFVVAGVIKSNDQLKDYIYMADEHKHLGTEDYNIFDIGYLLKDDELYLKLYQYGGDNLLTRTSSYLSQSDLPRLFYSLLSVTGFLFILTLGAIGESKTPIDIDEKRKQDKMVRLWIYKKMGFKKYFFKYIIGLIMGFIFLSAVGIAIYSNRVSLFIAPLALFNYPFGLIYITFSLLVFTIDIVSKVVQTREKREINQLRKEYLVIRLKMIKPYVKKTIVPLVIIMIIVLVIIIIIF